MSQGEVELQSQLLINWLRWFEPEFRAKVVSPVQSRFPIYPLPRDIQAVIDLHFLKKSMLTVPFGAGPLAGFELAVAWVPNHEAG